ncbi:MAG: 4Fe-4S binding protein [Theionarchaea archaeon]|nr:4Fe-4S binding protein [Theionarchaea archaeon]
MQEIRNSFNGYNDWTVNGEAISEEKVLKVRNGQAYCVIDGCGGVDIMTGNPRCDPTRKQGCESQNEWSAEEISDIEGRIHTAVTVPVETQIRGNHRVLNLEEVRKYLEDAWLIVLMDCTCRVQMRNCDFPVHTCLRLNERGEQALTNDRLGALNPGKATVEEALAILDQSHKAGLVHLALAVDQEGINEICSCCSCCCLVLSAAVRSGALRQVLTFSAVAVTDSSRCIGCGVCVERCQFGARDMGNGGVIFDPNQCSGCGLCVSTCPAEAITLEKKGI